MTNKEILDQLEKNMKEMLYNYKTAADERDPYNLEYNIGRIHAIQTILWSLEDMQELPATPSTPW